MMNNSLRKCFGIDIGGTTVKIGLFEEDGTLLEKYERPTRKEDNGSHILEDIWSFLCKVMEETGIAKENVLGIGAGVPGSVTADGTVNKCVNLGWDVFNVEKAMQEISGLTVKAGNDANMAALGEDWKGGASEYSSMMLVTLGTGVGGGIIIDGKPLCGFNGAAAEIGHMPIVTDITERCNCGKSGCLEQVASASGIVNTAKKRLAKTDMSSSLRQKINLTAKDVIDEAKNGDAFAVEVMEYVSCYLGTALAAAASIIDPECFVIGGGVSKAGEYLIDMVSGYYKEKAFHASVNTKIVLAKLGNDAGIYGAAKLLLDAAV